jgi:hypothetical protein
LEAQVAQASLLLVAGRLEFLEYRPLITILSMRIVACEICLPFAWGMMRTVILLID